MYASVIVDIKNKNVNRLFDYIIPDEMADYLDVGCRVLVPFGSQKRLGYVIEIKKQSSLAQKEIIKALDVAPTISKELFIIADYIKKLNVHPFINVINTIVPIEFSLKYQKQVIKLGNDIPDDLLGKFSGNVWLLRDGDDSYYSRLKRLQTKGQVEIVNVIKQKQNELLETTYEYSFDNNYKKIDKYKDILNIFYDDQVQSRKNLLGSGFSVTIINTLLKNQVLIEGSRQRVRKVKHIFDLEDKNIKLNDEQKNAYYKINKHQNENKVFLLNGVTGSGKTEIYLKVIKDCLKNNKKALILVPEISLLAPLAQRLESSYFDVAIISSGISSGERHDEWLKIKEGDADVVLGTRSAIFAPLDNIGVIIIDEEHDNSYNQEDHVLYDAIEIAKLRARYNNCPLILGSATPSIKSMYLAKAKEYELLELKQMAQEVEKPDIRLVDMKTELSVGNYSIFSNILKDAIKDRLSKKEQIILLFNRKGYANFVLCRSCGFVPTCPNCNISLTLYKSKNKLKCHYCGHEEEYKTVCPTCGKKTIKEVGAGIEMVEERIKEEFPAARVLRMDANTTTKKGSHENIWYDFKNYQADILLGTQMIAKGFDFDQVTLVGVLMADSLLKVPSYLASENAFVLLTQVIGRSGRKKKGEAIIQGYNIDNYAINSVLMGYDAFYDETIRMRKLGNYEPFGHINQLVVSGAEYFKTYKEAVMLKSVMTDSIKDIGILGPTESLLSKLNGRYRFSITLKYNVSEELVIPRIKEILDTIDNTDFRYNYYRFQTDFN